MRIKRNPLDILFSRYIRLRAKGRCDCCNREVGFKALQTCHFYGRRYLSLRYDEENVSCLCFSCHRHFHEQPKEFVEWFSKRLGEEKFNLLQARVRVGGRIDKEAIQLYYQTKIKEIDKVNRGIE